MTWLASGFPQEVLIVHGYNITEIEVQAETPKPAARSNKSKADFVDPAIVSYGRQDAPNVQQPLNSQLNGAASSISPAPLHSQPVSKLSPQPHSTILTNPAVPATTEKGGKSHDSGLTTNQKNMTPSATLSGPFNDLSLNGHAHGDGLNSETFKPPKQQTTELRSKQDIPPAQLANNTTRRARKSVKKATASTPAKTLPELQQMDATLSTQKRRSRPAKGWRQTPLLSEPVSTPDSAPKSRSARLTQPTPDHPKGRRRRYRAEEDQNGWATGEVTDIQDMGDFNFEENLSKFDKRKVFDQIRQDDTTADEARLVSFNRLPAAKPGTSGGKNLHYTENVLDSPVKKGVEHSSDSDLEFSGTRMSRTSTKRATSRKGSALVAGDHHGSGSTFVTDSVGMARQRSAHSRAASPRIKTDSSTTYPKSSANAVKPSLRLTSTYRACPCLSPLQMLELEQLAISELGLTEDMMTENAARSIAETAYNLSTTEDDKNPGRWSIPLVVVLAGNHKTGSRAIAAARHLRNHGARVVLCVLGLEREDDLLDSVRRQLKVFRNCGGQDIKQDGLMRALRRFQASTDLIVDALLGMHIAFDDLRTDDQASYFQLVRWANGSDASTLSIDIPSGIDASAGSLTNHDSQPLHFHSAYVLSMGAPKTGLLIALERVEGVDNLGLYVADIGISPTAWKRFGTRRKHGVEFGGEWVLAIQYEGGEMNAKEFDVDIKWL